MFRGSNAPACSWNTLQRHGVLGRCDAPSLQLSSLSECHRQRRCLRLKQCFRPLKRCFRRAASGPPTPSPIPSFIDGGMSWGSRTGGVGSEAGRPEEPRAPDRPENAPPGPRSRQCLEFPVRELRKDHDRPVRLRYGVASHGLKSPSSSCITSARFPETPLHAARRRRYGVTAQRSAGKSSMSSLRARRHVLGGPEPSGAGGSEAAQPESGTSST